MLQNNSHTSPIIFPIFYIFLYLIMSWLHGYTKICTYMFPIFYLCFHHFFTKHMRMPHGQPSRLARTCHSHTTSPGSTHALFAVLVRGETAFAPGKRELLGGLAGPGTGGSRAGVQPRWGGPHVLVGPLTNQSWPTRREVQHWFSMARVL
jgi:hypothetical protein